MVGEGLSDSPSESWEGHSKQRERRVQRPRGGGALGDPRRCHRLLEGFRVLSALLTFVSLQTQVTSTSCSCFPPGLSTVRRSGSDHSLLSGAVLGAAGCLAAALVSTLQMPAASSPAVTA